MTDTERAMTGLDSEKNGALTAKMATKIKFSLKPIPIFLLFLSLSQTF